jgi:hypothetical protein
MSMVRESRSGGRVGSSTADYIVERFDIVDGSVKWCRCFDFGRVGR